MYSIYAATYICYIKNNSFIEFLAHSFSYRKSVLQLRNNSDFTYPRSLHFSVLPNGFMCFRIMMVCTITVVAMSIIERGVYHFYTEYS